MVRSSSSCARTKCWRSSKQAEDNETNSWHRQRKSSLATASPCGPHLGSVILPVRVAAQAFRRDRMCGIENALEDGALGVDDNRHRQTTWFARVRLGVTAPLARHS